MTLYYHSKWLISIYNFLFNIILNLLLLCLHYIMKSINEFITMFYPPLKIVFLIQNSLHYWWVIFFSNNWYMHSYDKFKFTNLGYSFILYLIYYYIFFLPNDIVSCSLIFNTSFNLDESGYPLIMKLIIFISYTYMISLASLSHIASLRKSLFTLNEWVL